MPKTQSLHDALHASTRAEPRPSSDRERRAAPDLETGSTGKDAGDHASHRRLPFLAAAKRAAERFHNENRRLLWSPDYLRSEAHLDPVGCRPRSYIYRGV